jgi:threonine dehydrogenase-like Zn-dependent dehydrogenase
MGFDEVVNPAGGNLPTGLDSVFEAAGSCKALLAAVSSARDMGSLTVVGRDPGDIVFPHAVFENLMRKELTLQGCWGYSLAGEESLLAATLDRGNIDVVPMITNVIELSEAPRTIKAMIDRGFFYCKVLIRMGI